LTYSIVAHCRKSGQYGIGIATYSPNVGARCPLVVPGKGAASIQSVANPPLRLIAQELIGQGLSAEKVVSELLARDPYPDARQIAVLDARGHAYAVSGRNNPDWAGHHVGDDHVCSGNALSSKRVVAAMAKAFESSAGEPLGERLMRAVEAGRDAGGQPEGQNSAALLVGDKVPFPIVDLRVDLHDAPEAELRRLWDWYAPMVPYYAERPFRPQMPRWWQWRMDNVPGWKARHLAQAAPAVPDMQRFPS